jgi:hypothetical protein
LRKEKRVQANPTTRRSGREKGTSTSRYSKAYVRSASVLLRVKRGTCHMCLWRMLALASSPQQKKKIPSNRLLRPTVISPISLGSCQDTNCARSLKTTPYPHLGSFKYTHMHIYVNIQQQKQAKTKRHTTAGIR